MYPRLGPAIYRSSIDLNLLKQTILALGCPLNKLASKKFNTFLILLSPPRAKKTKQKQNQLSKRL